MFMRTLFRLACYTLREHGTTSAKRYGKKGIKSMGTLVLVIDDSLVVRKILEICLSRAGYEVKSFPDGVEALCSIHLT